MPKRLSEALTESFIQLTAERYPNADRVLKAASQLGFRKAKDQILIISLFRDEIRRCAPLFYRSTQHRDDLYKAIIEALERLEEQVEAEEDAEMRAQEQEEEGGVT
jgi:hypothetical protein